MNLSRTETARRRRAQRRRRLLAANAVLIAAIIAVFIWNGQFLTERPVEDIGASAQTEEMPSGVDRPSETGDVPAETEQGRKSSGDGQDAPGEETAPAPENSEEPSDTVTFAFVGDVLLGENVGVLLEREGYDYPYVHVKDILQRADLAAANLETAVTAMDGEKPGRKSYEFRSKPEVLPAFRDAGFDVVNLANNHSLDFGPQGLRDTIQHLSDNGIAYVGVGESREEAFAPAVFEKNGVRVAVLGVSYVVPFGDWKAGQGEIGVADAYDYTPAVQAVAKAKEEADLVVVLTHWGYELEEEPDEIRQVDLGRRLIDAGADLVVGSHPHVLQGIEYYKGRWIAYSLGNFIFTKSHHPATYETGILEAACTAEGSCELKLTPFLADTPQPRPMAPEASSRLLARISERSVGAVIDSEGRVVPQPAEP